MSINKAQASALADGFLDGLGSGKEGLRPKETLTELFVLAGELIEDAQKNLIAAQSIGSGKLSSSLIVDDPVQNGGTVRADVLMNYYGRFVNKGVRGTESGNGLYKFKTKFPGKAMIKALEAGIATAKKRVGVTNTKKTTSGNEKKNAGTAQARAFGAGVNILRYGIKPTGFLDKAVISTQSKVRDRLGAALKITILRAC